MTAATPLLRWLLSSGADVVGRLLLQIGGTVLFTRLLDARDFGAAALIAVFVNMAVMIATAPFEEALTQRRHVRRAHFESALAAALGLAAVLWGLIAVLAASLPLPEPVAAERLWPAHTVVHLYALIVFVDAALAVHVGLARRQRRFHDIALGNLVGLVVGTVAGLAWAGAGGGAWSLLLVQPVARTVNLLLMVLRSPVRLLPRASLAPLRQLSGFGGWYLGGRLLEGLSDAAVQSLVTRQFGLDGNGYLNMAMRVIEPIRGATSAIGHNLAMARFARLQAAPDSLRLGVQQVVTETALVLQPVFVGLAVTAPLIIAVIGGPDWSAAGPIAVALALAAAVGSASNFVHSAVAARGRADLGFLSCLIEMAGVCLALVLLAPLGLVAIGLARLLAWLVDAAWIGWQARRLIGLPIRPLLASLATTGLASAAMAAVVIGTDRLLAGRGEALRLAVAVAVGIAAYAPLAWFGRRPLALALLGRLRQRPERPS